MELWQMAAVLVAGMVAGTVNTVVGAGTLITFPLLVTMGIQPLTANVSNGVGLVPAAVTGAWGYRHELAGWWPTVARMAAMSAVGGVLGALLLLAAPAETFTQVVPWLLVVAAVLAAAQPRVGAWVRRRATERAAAARAVAVAGDPGPTATPPSAGRTDLTTRPLTAGLALGIAATGVYGGYFGAAQGVVLISLLGILWTADLQRANGAKNVLAGVANLISAIVFIAGGLVDWRLAGLIAVGAAIGGVIGARVGRRLPPALLRGLIVVVALTAATVLWTGG